MQDRVDFRADGGKNEFATGRAGILHPGHEEGKSGAIQISDRGQVDDDSFWFFIQERVERDVELRHNVEIDLTVQNEHLGRRYCHNGARLSPGGELDNRTNGELKRNPNSDARIAPGCNYFGRLRAGFT